VSAPQAGPLRLAVRNAEDGWVNFHAAPINTLEGAVLLARVRRSVLNERPALYEALKKELYESIRDFIATELGADPATIQRQEWPGGIEGGGEA